MQTLTLSKLRRLTNDQLGFAQEAAREQGGVAKFKLFNFRFFIVTEPVVIRELLLKHPHHLERDPFVARVFSRFMGNGVFVAEGELWKRQRKLMQPAFHAARIQEYADVMQRYTRELVERWRDGQVVAVDDEMTFLTLRIIAKTMYGVDLEGETAALGQQMKNLLTVAEKQLKMSVLPPEWLPTPLNRRQQRAQRQIEATLQRVIAARRADPVDRGDLLSMLLSVRDEDGRPMSERQILDECITLFVAGHETTAAMLTWTFYLLTQHPDVRQRLITEIDETVGKTPIRYEQIAKMPYLDAVLKETLRLYPVAPAFGRQVTEAFTIGEHDFPKGAVLTISTFATHRRPDLYERHDQFWPERFLNEATTPDRYTYFPFGAGSRICLGNMFAMLEAAVLLTTVLQHATFERAGQGPLELDTLVTLRPEGRVLLRVWGDGVKE